MVLNATNPPPQQNPPVPQTTSSGFSLTDKGFDFWKSLYYLFLLVIVYMAITAWDDLLDYLFRRFNVTKGIIHYVAAALFFTTIAFLILYILDEKFTFLFGIAI